MSQQIVFYDIPSRAPQRCWSPNLWKTRLVLNYKGLDYRTVWVAYPEIEALVKPHVSPNKDWIPYTLPAVQLPNGDWVMESYNIAKRLEQLYPEKPLNIELFLEEVQGHVDKILDISKAHSVPTTAKSVLGEGSLEYWNHTREKWFEGRKLEDVFEEEGGLQVYEGSRSVVRRLTELLAKDTTGPYFGGKTATYADFVWVGLLLFFECYKDGSLEALLGEDKESHLALLEACRPWSKRDDH